MVPYMLGTVTSSLSVVDRHKEGGGFLHHHFDLIDLTLNYVQQNRQGRGGMMRRIRREIWVKPWIGRRRQSRLYDQLMLDLRNETKGRAKTSCLCAPPAPPPRDVS